MEAKPRRRTGPQENPPVTEELLREMTCRIREAGDPIQIILFGSHARGEAGPHSDLDLLVVEDAVGAGLPARVGAKEENLDRVAVFADATGHLAQQLLGYRRVLLGAGSWSRLRFHGVLIGS